jgi:hypothetical protein
MLELILIVGIAIMCTAWYAQHRWRKRARAMPRARPLTGLEVLALRYAQGEIDRREYLEKKSGTSSPERVFRRVPSDSLPEKSPRTCALEREPSPR